MNHSTKTVWDDFWLQQGEAGGDSLPCADDSIDEALEQWWHHIASALPQRAQILDLATGNGIVLKRMIKKRPDLKAIGIDQAKTLPNVKGKIKLHGGMVMENMDFHDARFDAITSQFGIEYGDLGKIIVEIDRLLKPAGNIAFIMHRKPGAIVAHNAPRLEGLRWARDEMDVINKARNWLNQRALVGNRIPDFFKNLPVQGQQKFGTNSSAHEFTLAVYQSLVVENNDVRESLQLINRLEQLSGNEMGRIESLTDAALEKTQFNDFVEQLQSIGVDIVQAGALEDFAKGADFAWCLSGQKSE